MIDTEQARQARTALRYRYSVGSIPIRSAWLWWRSFEPREVVVVDRADLGIERDWWHPAGLHCDTGASWGVWSKQDPQVLVDFLKTFAMQRAAEGFEIRHVLRELCKIREFVEEGAKPGLLTDEMTELLSTAMRPDLRRHIWDHEEFGGVFGGAAR